MLKLELQCPPETQKNQKAQFHNAEIDFVEWRKAQFHFGKILFGGNFISQKFQNAGFHLAQNFFLFKILLKLNLINF
jgi:hypothetical protein